MAVMILFFVFDVYLPKKNIKIVKTHMNSYLKENYINMKVIDGHNKTYDFMFNIDDVSYYIRVLTLPSSAELVVNNKTAWQINYGGAKRMGKSFTKKRPIPELNTFILFDPKGDKKVKKIVVVYPDAHNLLQWVNESEMVIIEPKTNVHGVKVVTYKNLFDKFKIL